MTVEVAFVFSAVSLAFAIYAGIVNIKRNRHMDSQKDASQLTTVIVKLENIGNDITEMKVDVRDLKDDIKDLSTRLVIAEQQIKVLNNAVFKGNKEKI